MEELQSTEILDREILEDARKKAFRILKTADDTVQAQALEWEKKASAGIDDLKRKYSTQREKAVTEIMARLPVEKRRVRAQAVERLLSRALQNWYDHLERARVLAILTEELKKRLEESGEFRVTDGGIPPARAFFHKLTPAEAEGVLRELLPGQNFPREEYDSGDVFPAITIENSVVRITASIDRELDFFVHQNRTELTEALLGSEFIDDEAQPC